MHPGGPFWARKDDGAWSIPKGELDAGELADPLVAARREFTEELGVGPPDAETRELGEIRQRGGKVVIAWAVEADGSFEVDVASSNTFEMEWPPRSGRTASFPEVDRAEWFDPTAARVKLLAAQHPLLERWEALLDGDA